MSTYYSCGGGDCVPVDGAWDDWKPRKTWTLNNYRVAYITKYGKPETCVFAAKTPENALRNARRWAKSVGATDVKIIKREGTTACRGLNK